MMKLTTKITYLDNFLLGFLAGVAIGIGGLLNTLLLSVGQKLLGSLAFSIGLISICFFGLHLFTGKVGYLSDNKIGRYLLSLLIMYIGNVIGAAGFGYLMRIAFQNNPSVLETIAGISGKKLLDLGYNTGLKSLKIFVLSFLCCCLVFLAVDIYKKRKNWFVKIIGIILCVALFVYTGMEHCIANVFYFAFGDKFLVYPAESLLSILISTLGNALGAITLHEIIYKGPLKGSY